MAFVRGVAGWFQAEMWGPGGTRQDPNQKPLSGPRVPPSRHQAQFPGSLGSCAWNGTLALTPRGPPFYTWPTLPSRSPTPPRGRVPRENYGHGARTGVRPRFRAQWTRPRREETTPTDIVLWGVRPVLPLGGQEAVFG